MNFYIRYLDFTFNKQKKNRANMTPQNQRDYSPDQDMDEQCTKVGVFGTYFYEQLKRKMKSSFEDFLKLIKKMQKELNKEIVLFPINLPEEQHWVICCLVRGLRDESHPYQAILYLDSLQGVASEETK